VSVGGKIALCCVLSTMLADAGVQAREPSNPPAQEPRSPSACEKGQPHQERQLADKGWRIKIYLDPCVTEPDARRILSAIRESRLVDRQLENPARVSTGRQDIPKVGITQVLSIALSDERELEVAPGARYTVIIRTSARSAPPAGLYLLVSVRGNEVEAHYLGGWLE
jgi:hypothetical protein